MIEGWQTQKLGEVCTIKPPKSEARRRVPIDSLVSFLPMESLGTHSKFVRATRTKPLAAVVGGYTYFADGDVLLAKITPCFENGKLGIARGLTNGIGFGSSEYMVLRPNEGLSSEWLYYYLSRETFRAEGAARLSGAVGHKRVPREFVENYPIPVPPPSEQRRVVAILDETLDSIAPTAAKVEENIKKSRAIFDSHLHSLFTRGGEGWIEMPLAELCQAQRTITYGVVKLGQDVPDGVPCLRTSNVRWLRIEIDGVKRISPRLSSEYSRTILTGGEVLVSVRGTLGGVAVAPEEMAGWNVSREVAVVPVDPSRIHPQYLAYLIGSDVIQRWLGGVKKGAAYVGVNIEDLRLLPVSVPGLSEQLDAVRHLDALLSKTRRLESIYRRKLATLEELKASLLHEAFSGRLTKNAA